MAPNVVLSAERRLLGGARKGIDWMRSGTVENTGRCLGTPPGRSRPSIDQWGSAERSDVGGGGVETSQPGPAAGRRKAEAAPALGS
jgi:hypothetical protein